MKHISTTIATALVALATIAPAHAADRRIKIRQQYLNAPISLGANRQLLTIRLS